MSSTAVALLLLATFVCWGGAVTGWIIATSASYARDRASMITGIVMGNVFSGAAIVCLVALYVGLR